MKSDAEKLAHVVGILADATADVDGWQQEAINVLVDPEYNPVVYERENKRK